MMLLALDHLAINTGYDLDRYARFFSDLGFSLTPGSRHSLGSVNRLMVFGENYLELVGLERGGPVRQELTDSRTGIDGLVFGMTDPEAVRTWLEEAGLDVQPAQHFSRTLASGDTAEFVTLRLAPGQFREGRVYFCRHLTPALVWQKPFMAHPNRASGLVGLTIISEMPDVTRQSYERLGKPKGFALDILSREAAWDRFGVVNRPDSSFLAITFRVPDWRVVAGKAGEAGFPSYEINGRLIIPTADGSILEFAS